MEATTTNNNLVLADFDRNIIADTIERLFFTGFWGESETTNSDSCELVCEF